jgi:peptidyl-prolyl cis-trans isomerase D
MEEPSFRGANGQFDRALFDQVLRDNSLSEQGFVREQRQAVTRTHLAEALTGELPVPVAAREAIHRYGAERRSASYLVLPPTAAGEVPAPTTEQLQAFYNDRKASFSAPEYRALNVVAVDSAALAKPEPCRTPTPAGAITRSRAPASARPSGARCSRSCSPLPRRPKPLPKRVAEGTAFETAAAEKNISPQDLELGTFAKIRDARSHCCRCGLRPPAGRVSSPVKAASAPCSSA